MYSHDQLLCGLPLPVMQYVKHLDQFISNSSLHTQINND